MSATPTPTTLPSSGPDAQCPVPDASFPAWHPRALELLSTPNHSLLEVAEALSIPLHQLARFVLSHDGLEAATDIQAASLIHARTAAAATLPKVVSILTHTLDHFLKGDATQPDAPNTDKHAPAPTTHATHNTPTASTSDARHLRALRAAHLLVRLANFQPKPLQRPSVSMTPPPGPPTASPPNSPTPQSPRLQPGHGDPTSFNRATSLPIHEPAFADVPASTTIPASTPHTPQSPRLQPGHSEPTPIERAFARPHVSSAPDAPRASDRFNERHTPPIAIPSHHNRQPLPLPLMPDAQCLMPSPPLPSLHPP